MNESWRPMALALLLALFALACGSFAPRPLPEPGPVAQPATPTRRPSTPTATAQPKARSLTPPSGDTTPTPPPPPPTATPTPPGDLFVGEQARIVARTGVNIRSEPESGAGRAGFFPAGALVVVTGGPVYGEDYIWWQVDDQYGKSGWVAGGDDTDLWLSGEVGEPRPVNRPVRLGDTVTVSVSPGRSLTVRFEPGERGFVARRVVPATRLNVIEGPVLLDGLRWWKVLRADGLSGWAAEGDGRDRWLTPLE